MLANKNEYLTSDASKVPYKDLVHGPRKDSGRKTEMYLKCNSLYKKAPEGGCSYCNVTLQWDIFTEEMLN